MTGPSSVFLDVISVFGFGPLQKRIAQRRPTGLRQALSQSLRWQFSSDRSASNGRARRPIHPSTVQMVAIDGHVGTATSIHRERRITQGR